MNFGCHWANGLPLSLSEVRFWFEITLIMRSVMFLSVVWTARWSTASSTAHPAATVSPSPTTCTALWKTWSCTTTRPHWSSTTTCSTCGWRTQCMHRCPQALGDEDSPPKIKKNSTLMGGRNSFWTKKKNIPTTTKNTCCNTSATLELYIFTRTIWRAFFLKTAWFAQGSFKCLWMWKKQKEAEEASFRWPALLPKLQLGLLHAPF